MNALRRTFLQGSGALSVAFAAGLVTPARVLAAEWNKAGFESKGVSDVLRALGTSQLIESADIRIKAPELAESGLAIPVEVSSNILGAQSISVLVERNAQPLVAHFNLEGGMSSYVSTRIKMGETSNVRVLVKAGDKTYTATKLVKLTIGGCGGTAPDGSAGLEPKRGADLMRIRTTLQGDVAEVKVLMNHPMETGQRKDAKTGQLIPAHFIRTITTSLNGRKVMEAQWSQAVSRNPFLGVKVKGARAGDRVMVAWVDTLGEHNSAEAIISA